MKLDPHEEKIRRKLSSQQIKIDTDQLWNKLEAFVPEQKPRRPKGVFLLWPLLFLSVTLGLLSPYRYVSAFTLDTEKFELKSRENNRVATHPANLDDKNELTIASVKEELNLKSENPGFSLNKSNTKNNQSKSYTDSKNLTTNLNRSVGFSAISSETYKSQSQQNELKTESEETRFPVQAMDKLNVLEMSVLSQKRHKTKKLKRIIRPQPQQISLSLGMSAGGVVQHHLLAHTSEFDLVYKHKQTDTGQELMGVQLGITYPLSKKFYIRSGVNYTRAASQLSINEERYSRVLIDGINGVWEDDQGNLHQVEGQVYATRKTNYQTRWTSYHHILDVPVSLGFRMLHYKRNLISIEAGVNYHLLHQFQGAVWDSEFNLNHDTSVANNFTHNKFSARAALEWEYRLSTSFSLFAGVQARDILLHNSVNELITEKRLFLINGIVGVKLYPGNM